MQTITRGYCRDEQLETRWRFAGYVTADGQENGVRPRAFYQSCGTCTLQVMTLGGHRDVPDALGLCLAVLVEYKRKAGQLSEALFDEGNVLGELHAYIWRLYNRWNPRHGAGTGTFRGYATTILRKKINTFIARDTGDVAGGRTFPKAYSRSVSTSLEGMQESIEERHGTAGLEVAFGVTAPEDTGEARVQWPQLTTQSHETIRDLVPRLDAGWSPAEVEAELGYRAGTVARRMSDLRRDIRSLQT